MKLQDSVITMIMTSDSKALASCKGNEPNVVPVSTVTVVDDTIWLMNYFMGTTLENILENPQVTFACWKGLEGIKVKANVVHITSGELLEKARVYVAEVAPIRTLKSLLVLTPTAVFDVTPEKERAGKLIVGDVII